MRVTEREIGLYNERKRERDRSKDGKMLEKKDIERERESEENRGNASVKDGEIKHK